MMARSDVAADLQRLIDGLAAKSQICNVVAGIQSADGLVDVSAAAGQADAAGSVAMSTLTPYYLASITKMYTATVVIHLANTGRVDLDAPISTYLSEDLFKGSQVIGAIDHSGTASVSQLLDQTSGLADYFEGKPEDGASLVDRLKDGQDASLSLEQIMDIVRSLSPVSAPGAVGNKRAHYSDTNYALLGAIIEATTAASVADNFQDVIFTPLGLDDTFVAGDPKRQASPAVFLFKDRVLEIPLAMASFVPDGGVVSTVADSLRFLRALFGGELVTDDQLTSMTRGWNRIFFPLEYGSGLMRYKPPRWMSPFQAPPELLGHSGSTGSFAFYEPNRDLFVAGTVNQMSNPGRPFRLMTRMLNLAE